MKPSVLVVAAVVAVAGCSAQDPLQKVSRLSDVELAEDAQTAGALPDDAAVDGENALGNAVVATSDEAPKAGLLGFFRRKADDAKTDVPADDVTAALREAQGLPPVEDTAEPVMSEAVADATDEPLEGVEPVEVAALGVEADVAEPEPAQKRMLFGAIFGGSSNASSLQSAPEEVTEAEPEAVAKVAEETAPVQEPVEEVETAALEVEEPRRAGLFGGFLGGGSSKPKASAAVSEVTKDETVPMGKMARLCGAPINKFAKEVAQHPETGRAKYKLYDSKPSSTGPRNWYVTGFDDGCARQFTASLAVFGSVEMHEQLRYGLPSKIQPYTAADAEYEKVKRKVCGVGKGTPCGSSLPKLDRMAVFLTIYPNYTGSSSWTNALLYDGDVAAIDIASR